MRTEFANDRAVGLVEGKAKPPNDSVDIQFVFVDSSLCDGEGAISSQHWLEDITEFQYLDTLPKT